MVLLRLSYIIYIFSRIVAMVSSGGDTKFILDELLGAGGAKISIYPITRYVAVTEERNDKLRLVF